MNFAVLSPPSRALICPVPYTQQSIRQIRLLARAPTSQVSLHLLAKSLDAALASYETTLRNISPDSFQRWTYNEKLNISSEKSLFSMETVLLVSTNVREKYLGNSFDMMDSA